MARLTGARVILQDDNRGTEGKPDLRIEFGNGATAVIEVVADLDPGRAAVLAAVRQENTQPPGRHVSGFFKVPDLRRKWWLGLLHAAQLGVLRSEASALLQQAEAQMVSGQHTVDPNGARWERRLSQLGVTDLIQGPVQGHGEVWLLPQPAGGSTEVDQGEFLRWIYAFLTAPQRADVRTKLGRGAHTERHSFIACTDSTDWAMNAALSDTSQWLPTSPPRLPTPITHVWLFNIEAGGRCLHYGPNNGWIDVQQHWRTA